MTRVLARDRRGKTQEEMGMMWPQAKEAKDVAPSRQPLEEEKETPSLTASRGT